MGITTFIRKLRGKNSYETSKLIVVCAFHPIGVSAQEASAIRDLCNASGSDGWWFLNPSTFQVFFRPTVSGRGAAAALASAFRTFRTLPHMVPCLGVGVAEGELTCELLSNGKLARPPLGIVINESLIAAQASSKHPMP